MCRTDIAEHASVFDFGDSGGIMAMVRHQTHGPASFVKFSMDEGKCWHTIELPEAIDVIGMRQVLAVYVSLRCRDSRVECHIIWIYRWRMMASFETK